MLVPQGLCAAFAYVRYFPVVVFGYSGTDVSGALCVDPVVCTATDPVCKQAVNVLYYNDGFLWKMKQDNL